MSYRSLFISVVLAPLMVNAVDAKTTEKDTADQVCQKYQEELTRLGTPELRARLKEDPQTVAASLDQEEISKIKRLIELDELVMFQCRIGLKPLQTAKNPSLNAAGQQLATLPALPVRKPRLKRRLPSARLIVPLPTRRSDAK